MRVRRTFGLCALAVALTMGGSPFEAGHALAQPKSAPDDLTMTVVAPQPTVAVQVPQAKVIVQQPAARIIVNQTPPQVVVAPAPAPQVVMGAAPAIVEPAASPAMEPAPRAQVMRDRIPAALPRVEELPPFFATTFKAEDIHIIHGPQAP